MNASHTAAMIRCVNACGRELGALARATGDDSIEVATAVWLAALSVLAAAGNAVGMTPDGMLAAAREELPELYAAIVRDEHGVSAEAVRA